MNKYGYDVVMCCLVTGAIGSILFKIQLSPSHTVSLKLYKSETVKKTKARISKEINIPPYKQKLLYAGEELSDQLILSDCVRNEKPVLQLIKSKYLLIYHTPYLKFSLQ